MTQSNLTIQVQIGNRTYPLSVKAEEQPAVLQAAEKINQELKAFEQKFKVKDQQDLLAMFSLQLTSEQMKQDNHVAEASDEVKEGLRKLNTLVSDYLASQ